METPPNRPSSPNRVLLCSLLFMGIALGPMGLAASTRDYVLQWLPPSGTVDGYRVYLGGAPSLYSQILDLGLVPVDPDGIGRATLTLDAATDYYVSLTAYNTAGESAHSNEQLVAASLCDPRTCDDAQECTADDCGAGGCTHTPLPDGTLCAALDGAYGMCAAGTCQAAQCTDASHCDDGNACNGAESCSLSGACTFGAPLQCGAPSQCSVPSCDPRLGCVQNAAPDGTSCDDGRPNTVDDQCVSGVCTGSKRGRGHR
jgi:hypothetical protein